MTLTIVVILVVVLLLLVIGVNMIQQHKEKIEAERRAEMVRQRAIIEETEELLSYATKLPMSKSMLTLLHKRNNDALRALLAVANDNGDAQRRMDDGENQLSTIEKGYQEPDEASFTFPDSDKLAVAYIQALKKLRLVLRSEHTRGRVDTTSYVNEEKRLDRLQLKISVENSIKRALAAKVLRQFGTAREMLEKAEQMLNNVPQPDDYTVQRLHDVARLNAEILAETRSATEAEVTKRREKEADDLDVLFQPKKKW